MWIYEAEADVAAADAALTQLEAAPSAKTGGALALARAQTTKAKKTLEEFKQGEASPEAVAALQKVCGGGGRGGGVEAGRRPHDALPPLI